LVSTKGPSVAESSRFLKVSNALSTEPFWPSAGPLASVARNIIDTPPWCTPFMRRTPRGGKRERKQRHGLREDVAFRRSPL
jgi:hypothetical protein